MKSFQALFAAAALSLSTFAPAMAQQASIGVVAPLNGEYAVLGEQMLAGARLAAENAGQELVVIDEGCEEANGEDVAQALADAEIKVAIGFFCSETLRGALPGLAAADIPAITVSVRSLPLMRDALDNDWPLFRLAPNRQYQVDAIVTVLMTEWASKPLALIDDGTIYYREMINDVRNAIEARGLKPVFVDTFRPAQQQQLSLVRRLSQTGATHVLVGGTRNDVAIIARDAREQGIPLKILGDDGLRAAPTDVPLEKGVLAIGLGEIGDLPPAAELVDEAHSKNIVPEGYVVPGAVAFQVASQALAAANGEAGGVEAALLSNVFDTSESAVKFNAQHELDSNPFFLLRWQGDEFVFVFDSEQ